MPSHKKKNKKRSPRQHKIVSHVIEKHYIQEEKKGFFSGLFTSNKQKPHYIVSIAVDYINEQRTELDPIGVFTSLDKAKELIKEWKFKYPHKNFEFLISQINLDEEFPQGLMQEIQIQE
jgi:ribosomal protein S7